MATCKDCIHYDICKINFGIGMYLGNEAEKQNCFKDHNRFIELPFIAMVEQKLINGKFDKRRVSDNGKYAVVYVDKSKWGSPLIDITEQHYNTEQALKRLEELNKNGKEST